MITFPLDTLRSVADESTHGRSYLLELCEVESAYALVTPLEVAIILNAAIEAGVVALPSDANKHLLVDAYDRGYELGIAHGAGSPLGALEDDEDEDTDLSPDFDGGFYTRTPNGHTIHVNGSPDMSEETAQAIRELADKVHEMMERKMEAAAESILRKGDEKLTDGAEPYTDTWQAAVVGMPDGKAFYAELERRRIEQEQEDEAPTLSPAAAATLGPEHVVVTPLVPRRAVAPLAEDAPAFDYTPGGVTLRKAGRREPSGRGHNHTKELPKGRRGNVLPAADDMVALVREIAMAGVMPTMASFDLSKPGNWAAATSQLQRLGITWEDLRKQAGLLPNPRNTMSKAG